MARRLGLVLAVGLHALPGCAPPETLPSPEPEGVGEPCRSDGVVDDLCRNLELICVEDEAGIGGRCQVPPASCDDVDDVCTCDDLATLCGAPAGTPADRCFELSGRYGILCS